MGTESTEPTQESKGAERLFETLGLNPDQTRAAAWDQGHLLVLAGPGSGKTRTIIARAAYLLSQGTEAQRILALTFTRRAAQELKSRLKELLGERATAVRAGTFHNFALQSIRAYPQAFPLAKATVLDRDDELALFKSVLGTWPKKTKELPKPGDVSEWYSFSRNAQLPLKEYLEQYQQVSEQTALFAAEAIKLYKERKQARGYLDFDDILLEFVKTLRSNPVVAEKFRRRFDHILVDEMQDTNPLQWLMLDSLRDPARLFCVGDDAQSIYAFRGADFQNVHAFRDRVEGGSVIHLDTNYRSTQPILDLANWLLSQSELDYDKHLLAARGAGETPVSLEFFSEMEEADWIGDQLLESHHEGRPWGEHLVLARAAFLAKRIEAALIERSIPYIVRGGRTFLQSAHIKDVLAMMRATFFVSDELSWIRLMGLLPGVGEVTASRAAGRVAEGESLGSVMEGSPRLRARSAEFVEAVARVGGHESQPQRAAQVAVEFLEPLLETRYDDWRRRREDLQVLIELAGRFSHVADLLDATTIDPLQTPRDQGHEDERVTIATVHAAKGTEAEWVCICRVQPGIYPYSKSVGDAKAEEEERRILYVAITRAKDELLLTRTLASAGQRFGRFSQNRWGAAEPFLLDRLPAKLIRRESHLSDSGPWFDSDLVD
ncbi:MAG: ATP-dependent helicase [Planctomycetales bacterium]|nr:ATP-dependent helicase [Planctomycetales bacterium]